LGGFFRRWLVRTVGGDSGSWLTALLVCGALAPLLQVAADRIAGAAFRGYDFSAQSMSDLGAVGSPVRLLVILLTFAATVLVVAFTVGAWQSGALLARVVAVLIAGNALLSLIALAFFPNTLDVRPAFGTPGVVLMFLGVLCAVLAMLVGAFAFDGWMRWISIGIPASYVVLALVRYATAGSANTVTMIGAQERTMAYTFLLWMFALAVHLLLSTGALNRLAGASS
jgi:hypothetical protein